MALGGTELLKKAHRQLKGIRDEKKESTSKVAEP